ncbi:peroxiredoxin [Salibacterium aidingense]|uniref:peroxiredoxin n=1 Tax=Salibacterium aidingense TaxID=384933 RepID=UPI003BD73EDF
MRHQVMPGSPAPPFTVSVVYPDQTFGEVSLSGIMQEEKWTVLFFYPMDFTTVCPTEITSLSDQYEEFEDLDAEVIGVSTDTVYTHRAWCQLERERNGLGKILYPLGADTNHNMSRDYGVLEEEKGTAHRGLFIINPEGEVMYSVVHHHNVGRDTDETLRVLQALQTGRPCPANWKPGQPSL